MAGTYERVDLGRYFPRPLHIPSARLNLLIKNPVSNTFILMTLFPRAKWGHSENNKDAS